MNLLLVDDDVLMLQDLKEILDWNALGFQKVYTAENTASAQKMIAQVPVHVIVCDIEMPGSSGLDFMETLQNSESGIPCILLTSYARFEYARRAIDLNVVEYLLKPVSAEPLQSAVEKAVQRLKLSRQMNTAKKYSQYWLDEEKNTAEYFWNKTARGFLAEVYSLPRKLGYGETQLFIPVLIEAFQDDRRSQIDDPMWEYAVKNVGYEILEQEHLLPRCVISLTPGRWLAVVRIVSGPETDLSPLEERLDVLQDTAGKFMHMELSISMGNAVSYRDIYREVSELEKLLDSTMNRRGRILYKDQTLPRGTTCTQSEIRLWETLLQSADKEALKKSLYTFLQSKASLLTPENMQEIRQDFAQMVYSFLKQKEIQAHRLFGDAESDRLYQNAVRSIDHMYAYCSYLIDRALCYATITDNSKSAVEIIQNFLDTHYAEDIQRNDLSDIVFVSPDHLSRLFKKETGLSLMQYVTKKRITAACSLLAESRMPINRVALQVGYGNFAYFSKIFREITGMTPMNYRKQSQAADSTGKDSPPF